MQALQKELNTALDRLNDANFNLGKARYAYDMAVNDHAIAQANVDLASKAVRAALEAEASESAQVFKTEAKLQEAIRAAVGPLFEVEFEASPGWLVNPATKKKLRFDVYIPAFKVAIECDGEQHFKDVKFPNGMSYVENVLNLDATKACLCFANNVKLIRIQRQVIAGESIEWMHDLGEHIKMHIAKPGRTLPVYFAKNPAIYDAHTVASRQAWKSRDW